MLDIIPCPQCGTPAEVTQRFWLNSTDGPIQHLKTICLSKHWLTPRAETVHQHGPVTRAQPRDTAKLLGPGAAGGARQPRS
jgi:hypothetical protein